MEQNLVHGEGDFFGQPFRLTRWQRAYLYRLYEFDPATGRRTVTRSLLGLPKGNGKTELLAAVGLAELAGPTAPIAANVPLAAASERQAIELLYGTARTMVDEGPLAGLIETFETRMYRRDGPGRLYAVAAAAGSNDGGKPTCVISDELHEWLGRERERTHLVLTNSLTKRGGASGHPGLELNISTAGFDRQTLLGRLYDKGRRLASGEEVDPSFLFVWYEASEHWDLSDPEQLLAAIREANPAADHFWPAENLARRFGEVPEHEFRRYYLNQWVEHLSAWLPPGAWDLRSGSPDPAPDGADITLAFDGSWSRDSTGLVGRSIEGAESPATPHLFVVEAWERPEGPRGDGWRVPILDVEDEIRRACRRWNVLEAPADPYRWSRSLQLLAEEGLPVVEFPQSPARMVPATQRLWDAVVQGDITHTGDPRLARHVANAVVAMERSGPRLAKAGGKDSLEHIDLAVCAVMANDRGAQAEPGPYTGTEGFLW